MTDSVTDSGDRRYRTLRLAIALFGLALIGILWAMTLQRVASERAQAIAGAYTRNANLAIAVDEQVTASIRSAEQVLSLLRRLYQREGRRLDLRQLLKDGDVDRDLVSALGVTDAQGQLLLASENFKRASFADSAAFRFHRDHAGARLLIGRPLQGRITGHQVIPVSLRLDRPDGRFGGIVFAGLRLSYFSRFFAKTNLGDKDLIMLVGRDGYVRVTDINRQASSGEDMHGSPLWAALAKSDRGHFIGRGKFSGVTHLVSYRTLARYPLIVAVGTSRAETLAPFHQRERNYYVSAVLISAFILIFVLVLLQALSRQQRDGAKLGQLTRFYSALSQCNRTIVNGVAQDELFRQICRIAVDSGGMAMAWVALVDAAGESVEPAASHGEGVCFLENVRISLSADDAAGRGPTGVAIRENRPVWCQDYLNDPLLSAPWHDEGVRRGWAAMAALPLRRLGKVIGALVVYSNEAGVFDEPVRELLLEMADDISQALDNLAREAERKERERLLRTLSSAVEQSPASIIIADLDGKIQYVNPKVEQATGYSSAELIGKSPKIFQSGEMSVEEYRELWATITAGKTWHGEFHNRRKDGSLFWEDASISPILDERSEPVNYVAVKEDVTEHKAAVEEIQHLAYSDALTGLPNRRLLLDRLQQALASSARSGRDGALLFIDLDDFKTLNDTLGHDVGDLLLQQVGERLAACVREGDTVARLGGDEFVVMLEDLSEQPQEAATQAEAVGEKIIAALNRPYLLAGHERYSTPSIGVTLFADHDDSVDELLKRADLAMYQAKAAGRNNLRFFDPEIQAMIVARAALEAELRQGLQEGCFLLHYQPQVDLDGRLTGAEALLRWQHPERGLLAPAEFIPLAEDTGLILPLGLWVLESACRQLAAWSVGPESHRLNLAVNVSARQFRHQDFVDQVLSVLDRTGADPRKLKLELTESLLLDDVEGIIDKMNALKARGVSFSLDDFGTGYSSLSYLKRLPLYQLKIDQSFVRDVLTDPNDAAIAHTIVALAQILGLAVIAEGVETEAQRDFLAGHGCHSYQGFLYSRPLPLAEFERFMTASS